MASHLESQLTKLSLFALDQKTSLPIAHMPFYAEVGVRSTLEPPPVVLDDRFGDPIGGALNQTDSECMDGHQQCRERVTEVLREGLSRLLSAEVRNELAADYELATDFLSRVILRAREARDGSTLLGLDIDILRRLLDDTLRAEAEERGLGLAAVPDLAPIVWAHPMGILATDHAGYLSFDLLRLPYTVYNELLKSVAVRRLHPEATLETTIWIYPMARDDMRFDALAQGRFAHDTILLKIQLDELELPEIIKNLGYLSMQNPDLTDWRLSPVSFATNPGALIGADGCEMILPSNIALHEFSFHQVIGIPVSEVDLPIDPAVAGKVRPGFVNEYRLRFVPIGHSLGQILYSFPLAPGESVNFAVIDWTRRDAALRNETTKLDESLVHELRRDRIITETVRASIDEWQHGGSFMGGQATSAGGAMGGSGMGLAAGASNAIGGAYSTTSGNRDITADTVQKLSDNVAQAAASSRELYSTVVVQSSQAEHESIETRTVVNYNHSHAMTILYYEVLRHFRVVTEFVRRRPALLTNIHGGIAYIVSDDGDTRHEIYWPAIYENRNLLEAALLDNRYKEGFDILERRRHRQRIADVVGTPAVPAPYSPGDRKFVFFTFKMKTGGMYTQDMDDHSQRVEVTATLIGSEDPVILVNPDQGDVLNQRGSFRQPGAVNTFTALLPINKDPIKWKSLSVLFLWINPMEDSDEKVSFERITVTATDVNGEQVDLIDQSYETGHLIVMEEGAKIPLPTLRPPPDSPPPGPSAEWIEEEAKFKAFNEHLLNRRAHYERALRLGAPPTLRAFELASLGVGGGASLLEKVDNRPLEVLGDFVAYPCVDPVWSKKIMAAIAALPPLEIPEETPVEQLITLPTRGVFAEAKLGHCNASEEIDNTRFWDWQQSPIPHLAPEIASVQPVTPQVVLPEGLGATQFPASLLNIVNPPSAPDPQGMTAALTALATANIFRDMSGRAEVADLLKKLSDNSVAIAGVAQKAATGGASGGVGSGSGNGASSGSVGGVGSGSGGVNRLGSSTPVTEYGSTPTTEQRESQQIDNQNKTLQIAKDHLTPKQQNQVRESVTKELIKKKTHWTVVFTSEWLGEGIQQPMRASYSAHLRCGQLLDDNIFLEENYTEEDVYWEFDHDKVPLSATFTVAQITPPDGSFIVKVPAMTIDDLTLKAMTYDVPLRSGTPSLPETMKYTVGKIQADEKAPRLHFHGLGKIGKKEIELTFKVNAGGEILGEFGREFEKEATIEIVKLALKSTLKGAVKVLVGGEAGIKGTFEILYLVGYEVKQL